MKWHCLHGFLGRSQDWDLVLPRSLDSICYDLFSGQADPIPQSLLEWGRWVNLKASSVAQEGRPKDRIKARGSENILLGYSLGGRIGLHAILDEPDLWKVAVIVSAHPGLPELGGPELAGGPRAAAPGPAAPGSRAEDRRVRLEADQKWAVRFKGVGGNEGVSGSVGSSTTWDALVHDWNSQPVFAAGGKPLPRNEADFSRSALATVMETCSLGVQRDLRAELKNLKIPILWIAGEHDTKFRTLAEEMAGLNPLFRERVICGGNLGDGGGGEGVGHRVPWDNPGEFRDVLEEFCGSLVRDKSFVSSNAT